MEGDPPLECCQQDVCRPPLLLAKIGSSDLRMKEELCSGKSRGECRCDLSGIPLKYAFIAKVDMVGLPSRAEVKCS